MCWLLTPRPNYKGLIPHIYQLNEINDDKNDLSLELLIFSIIQDYK